MMELFSWDGRPAARQRNSPGSSIINTALSMLLQVPAPSLAPNEPSPAVIFPPAASKSAIQAIVSTIQPPSPKNLHALPTTTLTLPPIQDRRTRSTSEQVYGTSAFDGTS
jgi:hypothetical protein